MKVLITGAKRLVGRNLRVALGERDGFEAQPVPRDTDEATLKAWVGLWPGRSTTRVGYPLPGFT